MRLCAALAPRSLRAYPGRVARHCRGSSSGGGAAGLGRAGVQGALPQHARPCGLGPGARGSNFVGDQPKARAVERGLGLATVSVSMANRTVLSLDQVHFELSALAGRIARRSGSPDLPGADRGAAFAALHRPSPHQTDDGADSILPVGRGDAARFGSRLGERESAAGSPKIEIIFLRELSAPANPRAQLSLDKAPACPRTPRQTVGIFSPRSFSHRARCSTYPAEQNWPAAYNRHYEKTASRSAVRPMAGSIA